MADQDKNNKEQRTQKKLMKRVTLVREKKIKKGYKKERQAESKG
jgi:hypothetical protein